MKLLTVVTLLLSHFILAAQSIRIYDYDDGVNQHILNSKEWPNLDSVKSQSLWVGSVAVYGATSRRSYFNIKSQEPTFLPQAILHVNTAYYCERLQFNFKVEQVFEKTDSLGREVRFLAPKLQFGYYPAFMNKPDNSLVNYGRIQISYKPVMSYFQFYYNEFELNFVSRMTYNGFQMFYAVAYQINTHNNGGALTFYESIPFFLIPQGQIVNNVDLVFELTFWKSDAVSGKAFWSLGLCADLLQRSKILNCSIFAGFTKILPKSNIYNVSFYFERPFFSKLKRKLYWFAQKDKL